MVKCTKINVGFIPNPARGAYSTPLDLRAGKKGPTSKGRQGYRVGRQEREGRQEKVTALLQTVELEKRGPTSKRREGCRGRRQEREGRQEKGGDGKGVEGTPHVSLNFPKEKGKNTCTQQ